MVYSAFYKPWGREFQPIGAFQSFTTNNGSLEMKEELFPNVKYHLNGRRLRVGINYVSILTQN